MKQNDRLLTLKEKMDYCYEMLWKRAMHYPLTFYPSSFSNDIAQYCYEYLMYKELENGTERQASFDRLYNDCVKLELALIKETLRLRLERKLA